MIGVAILGFGVVGSGVAEILLENAELVQKKAGVPVGIKYILDVRDFSSSPLASRFVSDFSVIEQDPDVHVVVESIGGAGAALDFVRRALLAGKHVVTSNKELIATHGAELFDIATARNLNLLFEGSVGGGIPILRPLTQCLVANHINEVTGILNGTTNFMLTRMFSDNLSFDEALAEARDRGYAESDPSDDLLGRDACRKICILASLALGSAVRPQDVQTEGIDQITHADVAFAQSQGYAVKLLGRAVDTPDGGHCIFVAPHFVPQTHPLFGVQGVYNAVYVVGDFIGDVMFYGRGAGKRPTASAMVADIIDAAKHMDKRKWVSWSDAPASSFTPTSMACDWYLRLSDGTGQIVKAKTEDELLGDLRQKGIDASYRMRILPDPGGN